MNTYLMLTTRTDHFNQEHVAGHYEFWTVYRQKSA